MFEIIIYNHFSETARSKRIRLFFFFFYGCTNHVFVAAYFLCIITLYNAEAVYIFPILLLSQNITFQKLLDTIIINLFCSDLRTASRSPNHSFFLNHVGQSKWAQRNLKKNINKLRLVYLAFELDLLRATSLTFLPITAIDEPKKKCDPFTKKKKQSTDGEPLSSFFLRWTENFCFICVFPCSLTTLYSSLSLSLSSSHLHLPMWIHVFFLVQKELLCKQKT